jgi:UDP-3-O-[3-hydroxymyristoyl] glucosamine N-acyltransferase
METRLGSSGTRLGTCLGTRIGELIERFGGQLQGSADTMIAAIAPLERAGPADLSFLGNSRLRTKAACSRAAALILAPQDDAEVAAGYAGARIVTANPYAYFARTAQFLLAAPKPEPASTRAPPSTRTRGWSRRRASARRSRSKKERSSGPAP